MSTPFDTPLTGYGFVLSHFGDSLRNVALRELGDASLWTQLVAINNLQPPYTTDDPTQASDTVILNGTDFIIIPAAQAATATPDPDDAFGTDILLNADGTLGLNGGGDFQSISGLDNLRQALVNALKTNEKELIYHPTYGTLVRRILGTVNGPTSTLLAAEYSKATIEADSRIQQVDSASAVTVGDSITVYVFAETINGSPVSAKATL
jgi:phage baseplate assembly protein W